MCAIFLKSAAQTPEIDYPDSDGQPMAETPLHGCVMVDLKRALQSRYEERPDIYVEGNMFLYYKEGDPSACLAPDVFLVQGVAKDPYRRIYQLWKEGPGPSFVIEVTSKTTRREEDRKKSKYRQLGVEEYFLFDPLGDYLRPRLQGFRLTGGEYLPMTPRWDGALSSQVTGLDLLPEGENLRLVDVVSGERLLWGKEIEQLARQQTERADQQAQRADQEARRADQEARRREQETRRAEAAEQRLRALEEEMARLRRERIDE
ncbi:MAG: Uma2 family endonuclease [Acidobacteriota bacterium]|nr:Uma2 family endonuclease [Acidobacteriota bacterium]